MNTLHFIVISSVRPEPTSAGQIILHRHLVDQPGITLEVYGHEPKRKTLSKHIRRLFGRLGKTRLRRFAEDFWVLWQGRWIDPELPTRIAHPQRTIVLTVAHGDGFIAAKRFARKHQLPLVSFFHDWWPDIPDCHGPIRRLLERRFKAFAHESDVALCVSEGMREALGVSSTAVILPPIPAATRQIRSSPEHSRDERTPFKILYSGNLNDYGPMLGDALEEFLKHTEILLQVRGSNPAWSEDRKAKMRANGRWLDFVPRAELDDWLASADAFLIPMVFDSTFRRRMETSFPSKLIEFAQFGKPLIIWGPDYCSAIRWGMDNSKAMCVTEPNAAAPVHALIKLGQDAATRAKLAIGASKAANTEFSPSKIQAHFRERIESLVRSSAKTFEK